MAAHQIAGLILLAIFLLLGVWYAILACINARRKRRQESLKEVLTLRVQLNAWSMAARFRNDAIGEILRLCKDETVSTDAIRRICEKEEGLERAATEARDNTTSIASHVFMGKNHGDIHDR